MRNVAVLGATGSIGASTLDVIARHPGQFRASVLAAHRKVDELAALCVRFRPDLAVIADPALEIALRDRIVAAGLQTRVAAGTQALNEAASGELCDTVVAAIVGAAGLESTLAAARAGKRLLLANKESVVMAGKLLLDAVHAGGGDLIPVDSEHNAIFQCLPGGRPDLAVAGVRRILLTASGGPFRGRKRADLAAITPDQACAHPKWSMGRKISVDSATLMNKGLEVIEAHWLFGAAPAEIEVVVHPQSLVHSLVEYADGSVLAQLGNPDMRTALAHALAWPQRIDAGVAPLDLIRAGALQFEAPDRDTFRCLDLAYRALEAGGTAPTVLNAANEVAVGAFLEGSLPFLAIPELIEAALDAISAEPVDGVEHLLHTDLTARRIAQRKMQQGFC
ncbi:MAG: 1-deoxy-D-xylulose-5-phosphate reductoisomerase [Rudaea sp.]|uniref:1-deoxy-D-xylulose-5-phosphate reductoisomerase n=1 Tax=unclassified Rudaea TaxID=2627037 RepID=UPI0010F44977|nr:MULTISPECIES: 1-deoxy-D-xylulose-5-phosphate reductoisomerase [unclassified Rudaea]MBN8886627.1 1-deoxy-D-xylulose-5-phosphate reductoisomerase [Rudaea sp.]